LANFSFVNSNVDNLLSFISTAPYTDDGLKFQVETNTETGVFNATIVTLIRKSTISLFPIFLGWLLDLKT